MEMFVTSSFPQRSQLSKANLNRMFFTTYFNPPANPPNCWGLMVFSSKGKYTRYTKESNQFSERYINYLRERDVITFRDDNLSIGFCTVDEIVCQVSQQTINSHGILFFRCLQITIYTSRRLEHIEFSEQRLESAIPIPIFNQMDEVDRKEGGLGVVLNW